MSIGLLHPFTALAADGRQPRRPQDALDAENEVLPHILVRLVEQLHVVHAVVVLVADDPADLLLRQRPVGAEEILRELLYFFGLGHTFSSKSNLNLSSLYSIRLTRLPSGNSRPRPSALFSSIAPRSMKCSKPRPFSIPSSVWRSSTSSKNSGSSRARSGRL